MNEQTFIDHIASNPDDDDTKLVYADWLDEQGDSRGQLIRLSVEMRRLRNEGSRLDPKWLDEMGIQVDRKSPEYKKSVFGVSFADLQIAIDVPMLQINTPRFNANDGVLISSSYRLAFEAFGEPKDLLVKNGEFMRLSNYKIY